MHWLINWTWLQYLSASPWQAAGQACVCSKELFWVNQFNELTVFTYSGVLPKMHYGEIFQYRAHVQPNLQL